MQIIKLVDISYGWMLGPIVPVVYRAFNAYRANPVNELRGHPANLDEFESDLVD